LREHGPMTTKELAPHLMAEKGLDTGDSVLARTITNRLIHSFASYACDAQSHCRRRQARRRLCLVSDKLLIYPKLLSIRRTVTE
jgi:hypothetical protein